MHLGSEAQTAEHTTAGVEVAPRPPDVCGAIGQLENGCVDRDANQAGSKHPRQARTVGRQEAVLHQGPFKREPLLQNSGSENALC